MTSWTYKNSSNLLWISTEQSFSNFVRYSSVNPNFIKSTQGAKIGEASREVAKQFWHDTNVAYPLHKKNSMINIAVNYMNGVNGYVPTAGNVVYNTTFSVLESSSRAIRKRIAATAIATLSL